ncbi:MAG: helix-turn-helix transcriptional regulator [Clostridia bacterium]|nr:helix-turn-helix transcriptional regulator [Clostridia bacterium]MBQ4602086.1 helix-turn-helix transcriptional regulator [Clostridia bacterium]
MKTTKIDIKSFVKIAYAHEHSAENYRYTLQTEDHPPIRKEYRTGVMEIGRVKLNPIIFKAEDKKTYTANEGDIFVIPPRSRYEVSTRDKGLHRHITTEAIIEYADASDSPTTLTLPLIIPKNDKIAEILKKIVSKSASLHTSSYFEECSDYMKLLSYIKKATEKKTEDTAVPPASVRYCTMAEKYAMDNIHRHIMVEEIAEHIGISKNYLTNIFSKYKGMPITEYINRMKLNHMLELMRRFGYSARRAGEFVGLDNVNYISRIFKKYYGVTLKEYVKRDL